MMFSFGLHAVRRSAWSPHRGDLRSTEILARPQSFRIARPRIGDAVAARISDVRLTACSPTCGLPNGSISPVRTHLSQDNSIAQTCMRGAGADWLGEGERK